MVQKRLESGSNTVIIIGTAHVSEESRKEVRDVIESESPDIVGVELDKARHESLVQKDKWQDMDIYKLIKSGKSFMFLANILLSNYQKRLGEEMGSAPGAEMVEALDSAGDADIALLDRDINITFRRAWSRMSLKEKLKILYSVLFSFLEEEEIDKETIENLKNEDMLSAMLEELAKEIPNVKSVLIDERDLYIAARINEELEEKEDTTLVAVVGAGHMNGIAENVGKSVDKTPLEAAIRSRNYLKAVAWGVPLLFIGLLAWGFLSNGSEMTFEMLKYWFLINGTLSTIGVLCALGHPISAAVAFIVAPFTSLNPTVAAGWFAGISEAYLRKPKVRDFEMLSEISSVGGLWKNKITRTILVVAFANLGSTIGTVIALPYIMSLL